MGDWLYEFKESVSKKNIYCVTSSKKANIQKYNSKLENILMNDNLKIIL